MIHRHAMSIIRLITVKSVRIPLEKIKFTFPEFTFVSSNAYRLWNLLNTINSEKYNKTSRTTQKV